MTLTGFIKKRLKDLDNKILSSVIIDIAEVEKSAEVDEVLRKIGRTIKLRSGSHIIIAVKI